MKGYEKWLLKSANDLKGAKLLYEADCLDLAIYHTQQCAEKALKSFLVFCKHPPVKTHDVAELVDLCKAFDPHFSILHHAAEVLTPYGMMFRYPEEDLYPKKHTVKVAIEDAEKIYAFVKTRLR